MQSGDIDSAVYYLNQAITWEPDRYQYYIKLGEALYADTMRLLRALRVSNPEKLL